MKDFPARSELLVLGARLLPRQEACSRIRELLQTSLDWEGLLSSAGQEAVSPLLFRSLKGFADLIPRAAAGRLESIYYRNLARNTRLYWSLKPLLDLARAGNIRVLLTKGARLAATVYGDIGLRPFTDIDLIVHPDDWPAFRRILDELSFQKNEEGHIDLHPYDRRLDWTFSPYYYHAPLLLEIHFNPLGLHIPLSSERELWAESRTIQTQGLDADVLSPEHEFCYLCLHAQQHSYQRLIWLTDIAELPLREGLDWDKVVGICEGEKIAAPVYYGLFLAETLWPGTAPASVLEKLRAGASGKPLLHYFWPADRVRSRGPLLSYPYYMPTLFSLLARKKPGLLLRTVAAILFPPREWVRRSLGLPRRSFRVFFHYAWRIYQPFGLLVRKAMRIE